MRFTIQWIRWIVLACLFVLVWLVFANVLTLQQAFIRTLIVFAFFSGLIAISNAWLIPVFFQRHRFFGYALLSIGASVVLAVVRVGVESMLHVQPVIDGLSNKLFSAEATFFSLFVFQHIFACVLALTYYLVRRWFEAGQKEVALKAEKLEAEINLLKSQIQPHFLFNTLNNIYSLAYLRDHQAPAMILKLSEMMRYLIYECQAKDVMLEREIAFLQNFLDLQKLKSVVYERISFCVKGVAANHYVPPLLLLPFFENLFKHSDLDQNDKGWAKAAIVIKSNYLKLEIMNTYRPITTKSNDSGFGIPNVINRLKLLYGNSYTLDIWKDDIYKIQLQIPLR